VRNLPAVAAMGFPMFARSVAVSHAYLHMVDFGSEVEIFGLKIRSGDLLVADCHGVISIPLEIVDELPAVAARIHAERRRIIGGLPLSGVHPRKTTASDSQRSA
jgi:regulator of RNase E activity RraA